MSESNHKWFQMYELMFNHLRAIIRLKSLIELHQFKVA